MRWTRRRPSNDQPQAADTPNQTQSPSDPEQLVLETTLAYFKSIDRIMVT